MTEGPARAALRQVRADRALLRRRIGRVVPGRLGVVLLGAATIAVLMTAVVSGERGNHSPVAHGVLTALPFLVIIVVAMLIWRLRQQDERTDELLARLDESRGAELRAAALAERQRLAREMHDVLAHSLSGLVLQLEGARLLTLSDPADPRLSGTIDRAHQLAKSGLIEARQAIGMLRDEVLPGPGELPELVSGFAAETGIPCQFSTGGEPREVASAVRLALYRVAQEALTNVRKHASHPDRVDVRLDYRASLVTLTVEDSASLGERPPEEPRALALGGGGYGLAGMRERAELLGGTLAAAATSAGFRVELRVPA